MNIIYKIYCKFIGIVPRDELLNEIFRLRNRVYVLEKKVNDLKTSLYETHDDFYEFAYSIFGNNTKEINNIMLLSNIRLGKMGIKYNGRK